MIPPLASVEPLTAAHLVADFDCGIPELTDWLQRFGLVNQRNASARVYVTHRGGRVVGYYALAAGAVGRSEVPARVGHGLANHLVPVILLARLAVDRSEQGHGLGAALLRDALLRDALLRVAQAADLIGARALLVHAQDESARGFYERFDFEPSPIDPLQLFLLMKDLRAALASR